MTPKYNLPFKTRFLLFAMDLVRGNSSEKMTLEEIQEKRKPLSRNFVINWVLGNPASLYKMYDQPIPVRDAEINARFYIPSDAKNLPIILNFHGGGWTLGNLQQSDYYCSHLAVKSKSIVISVDYRMAPEHPFPVPSLDTFDSVVWAHENAASFGGDPARIGVTGDSAGGNLAAVTALRCRDEDGPKLRYQALLYPATNGTFNFPSYEIHTNAPILSQQELHYYRDNYESKKGDHLQAYFSPYLADDHSGLPPAIVLTAGYDPLVDDGKQYVEKLQQAGVEAEWKNFETDIHGFICFPNHSPGCKPAIDLISANFVRHFKD